MNSGSLFTNVVLAAGMLGMVACSGGDSKTATAPTPTPTPAPAAAPAAAATEAKAPVEKTAEKAKATKIAGDVGLLDTDKNYLIIVTKEGKLVTVDFDPKFQPTQRTFENSKIADIGLGSAATVTYTKQGEKNIATGVEYLPAKGE